MWVGLFEAGDDLAESHAGIDQDDDRPGSEQGKRHRQEFDSGSDHQHDALPLFDPHVSQTGGKAVDQLIEFSERPLCGGLTIPVADDEGWLIGNEPSRSTQACRDIVSG